MNTDQKNKELLALCDKLSYRQRIIFSDEGNLTSPSRIYRDYQRRRAACKPEGLWYSFGRAWVDYLHDEEDVFKRCDLYSNSWARKRLAILTHVYKLHLNRKKIYCIRNGVDLAAISKRYGTKRWDGIKWYEMEDDGWCGVEIRFMSKNHDKFWYRGWDVSSGCIWDCKAVRRIELVKAWKPEWKPTRSQVRPQRRLGVES